MKLQIALILFIALMVTACDKKEPVPETTTTMMATTTIQMPTTTIEVPADGQWCGSTESDFGPCWLETEFLSNKCVVGKTMPGRKTSGGGCLKYYCKDKC